jgi:hypothetical protein
MECEALEIRMITEKGMLMEEISTRDAYVDELHRRIATMGGENAELKADMSSYLPLVASLSAQISVLEEGTRLLSELNKEGKLVSCFICPSNCSIFHSPLICNMPFLIKTFTIVPVKQESYFFSLTSIILSSHIYMHSRRIFRYRLLILYLATSGICATRQTWFRVSRQTIRSFGVAKLNC